MFALYIYLCKFLKNIKKKGLIMLLIIILSLVLVGICLFVPYYLMIEEQIEDQRKKWLEEQEKWN